MTSSKTSMRKQYGTWQIHLPELRFRPSAGPLRPGSRHSLLVRRAHLTDARFLVRDRVAVYRLDAHLRHVLPQLRLPLAHKCQLQSACLEP